MKALDTFFTLSQSTLFKGSVSLLHVFCLFLCTSIFGAVIQIDDIQELMNEAKKSAEVTHNHPEGIKGAQAIALCILLARKGYSKIEIKSTIEKSFKYNLDIPIEQYRTFKFDVSCQGSVPQAIVCFLESSDFENCLRLSISSGGDSDTVAAMACSIAEAFYQEIPLMIEQYCLSYVFQHPHFIYILDQFTDRVNNN